MRLLFSSVLVAVLALVLLLQVAAGSRVIVSYQPGAAAAVAATLKQQGHDVLLHGPNFYALQLKYTWLQRWGDQNKALQKLLAGLRAMPGVTGAMIDTPRYAVQSISATGTGRGPQATANLEEVVQAGPGAGAGSTCAFTNKQLSNNTWPEMAPWGIAATQADSPLVISQDNGTIKGSSVFVCIVDSGLDTTHPEFAGQTVNSLDGCKEEDVESPGGCPFSWDNDTVGHGTHVAGTIAAPHNGQGIVGVIPNGAEVYTVRIYNTTGDVMQGQGFVYGSTLILAYTQCEGRLRFLQASYPTKKYRMVVNLSLGAAGPLAIEKMYFREAYAQGDTIWVAAAGNNGTDGPEALDAKGNNWCSYPACYPEVISVGAVNCTLGKSQFSQKNGMIQVVGPGEDMVSTRPLKYMEGGTRGFLQMKDAPGLSMRLIGGAVNGGVGNATGPLVWCGLGNTPCDVPPGGICMYTAAGRGMPNPARGLNFCDRVLNCTKAGGAGVVLTPPANWNLTGKVEDYPLDRVPVIGLNCTALNCSCWAQYSATPVDKRAPAVVVSRRQANQLRAALNVASAAGKQLSVEIQTQRNYWDTSAGTSMATPYVTGVIARVWGLFPECNNTEITNAVYASAKDLGPRGKDVQYGWGLVQMEAAYKYLLTQPCGKQSLQSRKQTRSPAVPTAKPRSPAPARSKPGVAPPLVLKPPAAKVAPVVARRTGAAAASN